MTPLTVLHLQPLHSLHPPPQFLRLDGEMTVQASSLVRQPQHRSKGDSPSCENSVTSYRQNSASGSFPHETELVCLPPACQINEDIIWKN